MKKTMKEVREEVLLALQSGPKNTPELMEITGANRPTINHAASTLIAYNKIQRREKNGPYVPYELIGEKPRPQNKWITVDEVRKVAKKLKIGEKLRVFSGDPMIDERKGTIRTVVAKSRHLAILDDGHSVTYAQIALYKRRRDKWKAIE